VARQEFAEHGLAGARVDAIAARTSTAKRMIYYYFGSKEGLYLAVLEAAYADIRRFEGELNIDQYPPAEAMARLIAFTFDYDEAHPDFIRLVCTENMQHARHMLRSATIKEQNRGIIATLQRVLDRGQRDGVFRQDVDAVDIHLLICFFRVSNRYTFGALFGRDLSGAEQRAAHKQMLTDVVLNILAARGSAEGRSIGVKAA
jgi:AcrR family transcriptional regulator